MILLHGLSTSSVPNKKAFTSLGQSPVTFTNSNVHVPDFQRHRSQAAIVHSMRDGPSVVTRQCSAAWFQRPISGQLKFGVRASKGDDWSKLGFDALVDPDSPDFDDIELDDEFYTSIGMTKEEAEKSQQFHPDDADPEGRTLTLDDMATLDPSLPEYIKKGLTEGKLFGPPIILLAGFRIEELPLVRYIVDAAGGQEVKVVPVREEMLHAYVEDVVEVPEPEWNKPRPDDFAMCGGWGSQRTIVFGGMKIEAQATVIEFLEEGGLPPICPTAATHETKRMKLGELLADAVKYQRSRQHSQNDPSDASDRIAEELPDINEHMHTVIKNRMGDLEKGLHQGEMDLREDEDGILRVQKKSNAANDSRRAETQEQEESENDIRNSTSFDGNGSTRISTPEGNLYDSNKADNNSNTFEESKATSAPNHGLYSGIVIDEKVESKEDKSWDMQSTDLDQSSSNPSVSTSQKVTKSDTRLEATPSSASKHQSDKESEGISTKDVSPSSTSGSQPVGKDIPLDNQSLHADASTSASNRLAPNQDMDEMFLIDGIVTNALGMDPSQAQEPEKPFDMDDLLNLPMGPGSVEGQPSKTDKAGKPKSGKESNLDVTEGTMDVAGEDVIYGLNRGDKSNLNKVSKDNSSETVKQESHGVGQHPHAAYSSEVADNRSGVIEPDEVITNDHDIKSDNHDSPARKALRRTVLPSSVTTDMLEEWIQKNTTESRYDPETHKHLFQNADAVEPHATHDTSEEGSKSSILGEKKIGKQSKIQLGEQNEQEILASLKAAVKQGIDPDVLKQMVDSIAKEEAQSVQTTGKANTISNPGDIDREDSPLQDLSNSSSSSANTELSEISPASPVPVDVREMEIIAQSIGRLDNELGSKFSQPEKHEKIKTSNEEKQTVIPTSKGDETTSSMSPDPSSGSVQTLTRSELESLADRQGISIDELLENVRRRGITLRE